MSFDGVAMANCVESIPYHPLQRLTQRRRKHNDEKMSNKNKGPRTGISNNLGIVEFVNFSILSHWTHSVTGSESRFIP